MISKLRWPAAIVAMIAVLISGAIPVGATDPTPPRTPRPTVINPVPTPSLAPITVLSVGDSLTEGTDPATKDTPLGSYRPEMSRLMNLSGQPHTWVIQADGGTKCSWWAARMAGMLVTYHPNLVLVDCGTNDTPTDNTEADMRTILAAVASYNAAGHNTLLVVALIGVPDMKSDTNNIRPYIIDWMLNTNLAIQRALASYPGTPVANMWWVPADSVEWLDSDGIHLTPRSNAAYGQLFFRAAQSRMGWLTIEAMRAQPMCGLNGIFRTTDPRPTPDGVVYRVCTLA